MYDVTMSVPPYVALSCNTGLNREAYLCLHAINASWYRQLQVLLCIYLSHHYSTSDFVCTEHFPALYAGSRHTWYTQKHHELQMPADEDLQQQHGSYSTKMGRLCSFVCAETHPTLAAALGQSSAVLEDESD